MITEFTQEEIKQALAFYLGSEHTVTSIKGRNGRNSGEFTIAVEHSKNFEIMEPTLAEVPPSREMLNSEPVIVTDEQDVISDIEVPEDDQTSDELPWNEPATKEVVPTEPLSVEEVTATEEPKPKSIGSLFGKTE